MKYLPIFISLLLVGCVLKEESENKKEEIPSIVSQKVSLENEIRNGTFEKKFPSGEIKIKGELLGGEKVGKWEAFYEDGTLNSEIDYRNGIRHGKSIVYSRKGQILYSGYYQNDKKVGVWFVYKPNGQLKEEINYGSYKDK